MNMKKILITLKLMLCRNVKMDVSCVWLFKKKIGSVWPAFHQVM